MRFRNVVLVFVAALALASLGNPGTLQAQAFPLKVTVPFDFYFANERFPAGVYIVERMRATDVLRVSDENGHAAIALTNAAYTPPRDLGRSQIVFNRYGDTYFMSEVRWQEYPTGRALPAGSAEVEIAKTITKQRVIAVIANR